MKNFDYQVIIFLLLLIVLLIIEAGAAPIQSSIESSTASQMSNGNNLENQITKQNEHSLPFDGAPKLLVKRSERTQEDDDNYYYFQDLQYKQHPLLFPDDSYNQELTNQEIDKKADRHLSRYNFGLGKRIKDKTNRFQFGLGKRDSNSRLSVKENRFSFGLGKRQIDKEFQDYIKRRFSFGLGKRFSGDGTGAEVPHQQQRFQFGLGK